MNVRTTKQLAAFEMMTKELILEESGERASAGFIASESSGDYFTPPYRGKRTRRMHYPQNLGNFREESGEGKLLAGLFAKSDI